MSTWLKAALVTLAGALGIGIAVGSLLGDPEPLPDVGEPVVLESISTNPPEAAPDQAAEDDRDDGPRLVHPRPLDERLDERRDARQDRRDARQDRREARQDRREARQERRELRQEAGEQRHADRADRADRVGDDDGADRDDRDDRDDGDDDD